VAPSYTGYLHIIDELLEIEARNLESGLDDTGRDRWRELTKMLFGPPMSEKRRYFRVHAPRPAKVIHPKEDPNARVVTLSGGGLFLKTSLAPAVGTEMKVVVPFPLDDVVEMSFNTEVRWLARPTRGDDKGYGVGLEFRDLDNDQRGAILGLLREHLIKNLELTLEKYSFFFRLSPDLTLLVDHHNHIVEANEQARQLALEEGSIDDRDLFDLVSAETRPALLGAIATARRLSEAARCEIELPQKGRPSLPVEALVSAVRTNDLDLGILIAGRDMTERKQIEAQRRDLERRLYQADKLASLGQIAAGIAHDINNPLAWVQSNLVLLERYADPLVELVANAAERGETSKGVPVVDIAQNLEGAVKDSIEGVRRIASIISDLKMFSRVEVMQEAEIDVNEALETSLRMVRNQIEQRAHVVRDFGVIPRTLANFGKISQVFLNLITNASRSFETPGVAKNVVSLRTWVDQDAIKVSVGDNGRGIPPEVQSKIFEPFFTMGSSEEGTGLGLTIARDAVKALGGEITLKSEHGVGTEFIVSIPLKHLTSTKTDHGGQTRTPNAVRYRLLVVDDEEILLRSFKRQLGARWDVDTARSGPEALERIVRETYDAILCDVMIPGMSGTSLYMELTARYPGIENKIVFMTGGTFGAREKQVLSDLPNVVVEKPFDMRELETLLLKTADGAAKARLPI